MDKILKPQKIDLFDRWNNVVEPGTKRQRAVLRFFLPHFGERGVAPCGVITTG